MMACDNCTSEGITVSVDTLSKADTLETKELCEKCFTLEMINRAERNTAKSDGWLLPVYTWDECARANIVINQDVLIKTSKIMQDALNFQGLRDNNKLAELLTKNLPIAMFEEILRRDLELDLFISLIGDIIKRIEPHMDRNILVSEMDAALEGWEMLVSLYYESKVKQEGCKDAVRGDLIKNTFVAGRLVLNDILNLLDDKGDEIHLLGIQI